MPWKLRKSGSEWLVVKEDDGKVVGRHKTRESAAAQLRALYANEPEARRKERLYSLVQVARKESIPDKFILAAYRLGQESTQRSVDEIVADYRQDLMRWAEKAYSGEWSAGNLTRHHRAKLREIHQQVFFQGRRESGVRSLELSPDDENQVMGWLTSQLRFVEGFSLDAEKAKTPEARAAIQNRIETWAQAASALGALGYLSREKK